MEHFEAIDIVDAQNVSLSILARACRSHDYEWPERLTSGIMFYNGDRITRDLFQAACVLNNPRPTPNTKG